MQRRSFLAGAALGAASLAAARLPSLAGIESALAAPAPVRDPSIVRSYGGLVVPPTGIFWGADDTTRGFTGKKGIETELKRRMAIRNRRYNWLAPCPGPAAIADAKLTAPAVIPMTSLTGLGAFPIKTPGFKGGDLTVTSYGQGLDRITNGEFDSFWTATAQSLLALGVPVIFRLFMEMNGKHNPYAADWQGGIDTGGQTAFISMWQHVWNVFNANGATLAAGGNCIFVFCAQRQSTSGSWKSYWPGDDFVDWSGVDLYRINWLDGTQNAIGDQDTYLWAVIHGKPYIVAESGFAQNKVVKTSLGKYDKDGTKTHHSLIQDHHTAVMLNPQCVAYLSWNNVGGISNDFIDTSKQSLAQYKSFANDPYCLNYRT